jgi:hypothetical protein
MNKHAPLITKNIVTRPKVPWYSDKVKQLHCERRRLEKRWRNSRDEVDWVNYKRCRNFYRQQLKLEKTACYNNAVIECGNDTRKLYRTVNGLLNKTTHNPLPQIEPAVMANNFVEFFYNKISDIRSALQQYEVYSPSHRNIPDLNAFTPLSEDEVLKLMCSSRATTALVDPCPSSLIKDNADILCPLITRLINTSLTTSTFASKWKTAVVLPLLKKPGLDLIESNYRPVSNLPYISKLVEKAVLGQLETHTQQHDLIPIYQSAYRRHHSTETALLKLHHDLLKQMEARKVTAFIGLDLSAAFDTVDHSVLLTVLEHRFGITQAANNWIESYLRPREFYVHTEGVSSSTKAIDFSVPQGSCLGPVLFTYYSSTLEEVVTSHGADICGYADDHGIFDYFIPSTEERTLNNLIICLNAVSDWMNANRLKMNPTKTEFIYFGSSSQLLKCTNNSLDVCGTTVTRTDKIKYLGVWLDKNLTLKHQITQKTRVAMYNLSNIREIRQYLTVDTCKTLVLNLVISHLDYANSLYFGLPNCDIQRLQRIQNAAAKLILGYSRFQSSSLALRTLHWLPIRSRIDFKIALLVFKCLHGLAPAYLTQILTTKKTGRSGLRSSSSVNTPTLTVPFNKSKIFLDRSFAFSGPTVWNGLPYDIRTVDNINDFKKKLKTFLFKNVFS